MTHQSPRIRRRKSEMARTARLTGALCSLSLFLAGPALAQDADFVTSDLRSDTAHDVITRDGMVQLVVDADDDLSDADVKAIGQLAGVKLELNSIYSDEANLYVGWVAAADRERALNVINSADGVEAADVNHRITAFDFPNDPLYQYQWHFDQIEMKSAWKVGTGKDVVVAVIDTGVAYGDSEDGSFKQAPDLANTKFVAGYDFVDDDKFPYDEHGHGTHVAGTIAQTTNNGYGVAGVAYGAKIMPLRVLNKHGYGSTSDIADSIRFAADNGAKVMNLSLGGPLPSFIMRSAVRYAHDKGVTIVAAAGNAGRRMKSYPAAYKHVIAVAATQYDRKTTFYSQWGTFVDIAAPGGNTRVDQNRDGRPDGVLQETLKAGDPKRHDFALYMGTSMASPHVAGAAAILVGLGVNNPDRVEEILKDSATRGPDVDKYEERYGAGILDASGAASRAVGCTGSMRLGLAGLLALLLTFVARRRDVLGKTSLGSLTTFSVGLVMASSGLFFLPLLMGDAGVLGTIASLVGRPLAELDLMLLGPEHHHNALMASALLPLGAVLLGLGNKHTRTLAAGVAIGFAAFLAVDAALLPSDIQWVPGIGILDRAWLVTNAVIAAGLGYLSLKRY